MSGDQMSVIHPQSLLVAIQVSRLQHHRHCQYLKKQPAVFDYRRNKPGKVKLCQTAQYRSAGSNQYQFARISVRKFGKRQYRRLIRNQILYQKFPIQPQKFKKTAIFQKELKLTKEKMKFTRWQPPLMKC